MARKQFNFILTATTVLVQQLAYADPDAPATVAAEASFDISGIPDELASGESIVSLAAYGLSQILQDRTSSVPQAEKLEKMAEVFDNLTEGKWREARASAGGTRKASVDVYFASGFAKFLQSKGKDVDTATSTALLQDMSGDERKALRAHPDVKVFIEQAKSDATEAAGQIDLADLLS